MSSDSPLRLSSVVRIGAFLMRLTTSDVLVFGWASDGSVILALDVGGRW